MQVPIANMTNAMASTDCKLALLLCDKQLSYLQQVLPALLERRCSLATIFFPCHLHTECILIFYIMQFPLLSIKDRDEEWQ